MVEPAAKDTLGIVGVGDLAAFMVEGLRHGGDRRPILLSPRNAEKAAGLATRFGATVAADNQAVVDGAGIVLLATPPKAALDTVHALRFRPGQLLISAAIDVGLEALRPAAPGAVVVRAMPSAAAAVGLDATPVCPAEPRALAFFAATGTAHGLAEEAEFAAATALSVFHLWLYGLMDAMAEAAAAAGIPPAEARRLAASMTRSAGAVALAGDPADRLRAPLDLHGKPGSMTAGGLAVLEAADTFATWQAAYRHALARSRGG